MRNNIDARLREQLKQEAREHRKNVTRQSFREAKYSLFDMRENVGRVAGLAALYSVHSHGYFDPFITHPSIFTTNNLLPVAEVALTYCVARNIAHWALDTVTNFHPHAGDIAPAFRPGRVGFLVRGAVAAAILSVGLHVLTPYSPLPENSRFQAGLEKLDEKVYPVVSSLGDKAVNVAVRVADKFNRTEEPSRPQDSRSRYDRAPNS